jgi:DNA-binding NarL/FixJ family response regulator
MPISVSLVEDDPATRLAFETWLHHAAGITLISSSPDAETAYDLLRRSRPDVALVDVLLPGESGIDLVRRLKPELPDTQFVILTCLEDSEVVVRALNAGVTGYLLKPGQRTEVLAAVREAHTGGAPLAGSIARQVVNLFRTLAPPTPQSLGLSPRELQVLERLGQGLLLKEIAAELGVGFTTVNTHTRRIYEKLRVRSRSQAVACLHSRRLPSDAKVPG